MNRQQDAEFGMMKGVKAFMTDNVAAVNIPILITYAGQLGGLIGGIEATSELTAITTPAITQTKEQARGMATLLVVDVRNMMLNYAADHVRPNPTTPASADNPSDYAMERLQKDMAVLSAGFIDSLKDEEVVVYFQKIWTKANDIATVTPPVINPLTTYGLKEDVVDNVTHAITEPGTLTQLQEAINTYNTLTPSPRAAIAGRKTQNKKLKGYFLQASDILAKMDNTFSSVKATNAELYNAYTNSRIVVLLTFATQIAGTVSKVTDLQLGTTEVVEDATISMTAKPYTKIKNKQTIQVQPDPILVQTDAQGKYVLPTPDVNTIYTVRCSLPGYENVIKTELKVKRGKKKQVDFLMIPVQQ